MNMNQVKEIARDRGVKPGKHKKAELIRLIQSCENNPQCFNTGYALECQQEECLWRGDCS